MFIYCYVFYLLIVCHIVYLIKGRVAQIQVIVHHIENVHQNIQNHDVVIDHVHVVVTINNEHQQVINHHLAARKIVIDIEIININRGNQDHNRQIVIKKKFDLFRGKNPQVVQAVRSRMLKLQWKKIQILWEKVY